MFTKASFGVLLILLFGAIVLTLAPNFHPEAKLGIQYSLWSDLLVHGGSYLIGTLVFFSFLREKRMLWILAALILIVSLILELIQVWVPGRSGSLFDFGCNCLGIAVALLVHLNCRKWKLVK